MEGSPQRGRWTILYIRVLNPSSMTLITRSRIAALLSIAFLFHSATAQCDQQVLHSGGSQAVGATAVVVSSSGTVDVNTDYCQETFPYFVGYDYGTASSGTGEYTFQFNPPVDGVMLNFSGLSRDPSNAEEIWLYVNGNHYAIPEAGDQQVCDALAVLTPEGNIAACANCSVSGWGGTLIPGPISTLTVQDTVLIGAPAGAIFSLFLCGSGGIGVGELNSAFAAHPYPQPAQDAIYLDLSGSANAQVLLYDANGKLVSSTMATLSNTVRVSTADLPDGIYSLRVQQGDALTVHRIVVAH